MILSYNKSCCKYTELSLCRVADVVKHKCAVELLPLGSHLVTPADPEALRSDALHLHQNCCLSLYSKVGGGGFHTRLQQCKRQRLC